MCCHFRPVLHSEATGGLSGQCDSKAQTLEHHTSLHIGGMFPRSQDQNVIEHQPQKSGCLHLLPPPSEVRGLFLVPHPHLCSCRPPVFFLFKGKKALHQFSPLHRTLTVPQGNKLRLVLRKPSYKQRAQEGSRGCKQLIHFQLLLFPLIWGVRGDARNISTKIHVSRYGHPPRGRGHVPSSPAPVPHTPLPIPLSIPRSPEPDSSKSSGSCLGPATSSSSGRAPEKYRPSRSSWGSMTSVSRI